MLFVPWCSRTAGGCWLRHQHALRVHGAAHGRHALRARQSSGLLPGAESHPAYLRVPGAAQVDILVSMVFGTTAGVLSKSHQHTLRVHDYALR
jgi:hypothetical protein